MNFKLNTAAAILAGGLVSSFAYAGAPPAPARKSVATRKAAKQAKPSVEDQIRELRRDLEDQINSLKSDLAEKDAQLKQAQQAAAVAQAAAVKAEAAVSAQQQAATENTAAVSTLQSAVSGLKANTISLATKVSSETAAIKKVAASPDAINFKGIALSPTGSFIAAETVNRSAATGGGLDTQFIGIPLQYSDAAQLSEFYGSGRQSRLALTATGKLDNMTLTAYYEMDWLGTGITSNNNQSNSYVLRQRQLWAQAALKSGWTFTGGQMWSLATETAQGLSNGSETLPASIDPHYEAGFVWTRQYGFRASKAFSRRFFMGIAVENAETLNPAGSNLPTNLLIGSVGNGGGLYNPTANYSFNLAPDLVAKMAFEPGWGHWELFGIGRFFRDRIYPNAPGSSTGAYNDSTVVGGIGRGFRGPLANKKASIGLKGLWGQGVGRYGSSTIADITLRPDGQIAPLRAFSALGTLELNPTPRLLLYLNYGGDYVYRDYFGKIGYGSPLTAMSGCRVEPVSGGSFSPSTPANCGANNKDVQEATAGYWYDIYHGPKGRLRQGLQYSYVTRDLWSGTGGTTNPSGGAQGTDDELLTSFRYYLP